MEDTLNLMGHALRKALGVIAAAQGCGQAAGTAVVAAQAGVPQPAASSLKAALDRDWDDPAARDEALTQVLGFLDRVEVFAAGWAGDQAAASAVAVARQVRDQDVDSSGPAPTLRRGVAKDRRISVEDGQMRHGRKSRSVLFDGYKRHVLRDLDTGLVDCRWASPPPTPRKASVTGDITADLDAAGLTPGRTAHRPGLPGLRPGPRPRAGPGHLLQGLAGPQHRRPLTPRTDFTLDFATGQLTCPAGVTMPFQPGTTVHFPKTHLRHLPAPAAVHHQHVNGRSVSIHPDEALLAELRERQANPSRARQAPRTRQSRARPRPRRPLARPPRPLPRHPQEPLRPPPRRRRPQPPRHRPPARRRHYQLAG